MIKGKTCESGTRLDTDGRQPFHSYLEGHLDEHLKFFNAQPHSLPFYLPSNLCPFIFLETTQQLLDTQRKNCLKLRLNHLIRSVCVR